LKLVLRRLVGARSTGTRVQYATDARTEWTRRTREIEPKRVVRVLFQDLLDRYLPTNPDYTCLEVGALPGDFLVYFHERHSYKVTGVDFADSEQVFHDTMRLNGVSDYEYVNADFLDFRPGRTFDVVASFGFVEHFDDYGAILQRHCDLVGERGYLVVGVPNFRNLQFVYHSVFDRQNLRIHNLAAMDPSTIHAELTQRGFRRLFVGYWGGLELWREPGLESAFLRLADAAVRRVANSIGRHVPNSHLYSPFILFIYCRADD
jgi:2-polyprenyl-3-methyl-5-hydroxy-6-metoxy-1,4-benzoquinol methylase